MFGACIYLLLADGKKQWWADGVAREERWSLRRRPLSNTEFYKKAFPDKSPTEKVEKGKEEGVEESSNAHSIQNLQLT